MRFWDFDATPYRPVHKTTHDADGKEVVQQADVFEDAMGRLWYAGTKELMLLLPTDPTSELKVPPEFWHPDFARRQSRDQHDARKRALDEERAEERRWSA